MKPLNVLAGVALAWLAAVPAAAQQKVELPARDRPLAMEMRTLFTLGAVDGEDHENFAMVSDVAFDARGNVYVLDMQAFRVTVFDAAGRFVRTVGRQGGGPGEFGLPTGIALLPTGELVVNDGARASLQVFGPDGEYRRSVAVPAELGRALGRLRASPAGTVITETAQFLTPGERRGGDTRITMPPRSVSALTLDDEARGVRLYNAAPRELNMSMPATGAGGTARFAVARTAFEPQLLWAPLPDGGVAALNGADYRITLTDATGRPARYLERPLAPRKVTAADRKRWLAQSSARGGGTAMIMATRGAGGGGAPPPAMMRVDAGTIEEKDVTWGEVVPVIDALGVDSFGRLWVQRSDRDLGDGPIDIIDAALRYVGTLPGQAMPRAFGPDGRVAYITRDELDVQHVVVRQITP